MADRKEWQMRPRQKAITTRSGNTTIVFPIEAIGLGQAVIVVAGNKIYHMAGLWDKVNREEARGANEAALAGKHWIEDHPAADTRGNYMRALHGGATCCEHTGFLQQLVDSIKGNRALMFGRVQQEEQMADCIQVGAIGTQQPKCEVCRRWLQYKGVVP